MKRLILLSILSAFLIEGALAEKSKQDSVSQKANSANASLAAGCAPPTGSAILDLNNVRTIVYTGGDMWGDLQGNALYEVPKNSGKHALFSGSLWMGGVDNGGQLKLAAMRFRQNGNDYWPGPLEDGTAYVSPETCQAYDRFFKITKAEVEQFVAWCDCTGDPNCDESVDFAGYSVPQSILDWPAHGPNGQNLAPYVDVDDDGFYDPLGSCDYPFYDLYNQLDCRSDRTSRLYGDETLWWVFNDNGNIHTETNSEAIGMEVHAQAFAFATNDEINDMTFYNYELINRASFSLNETYFAQWVDADLGDFNDDYVGCDVMRGLGYAYNGDNVDGSGAPGHYGLQPPAIGVDFFEGPFQDNDGIDNAYGIDDNQALNGLGYGDGIVDNERFGMRRFMYHNNTPSGPLSDPQSASEHYNLMRGIWKDNTHMVYGGNGHISGCTTCEECDFMFPFDSDQQYYWGTDGIAVAPWSEETSNNTSGDRRFLQSAGPFVLEPGAVNFITVGVVYARASNGGAFASVEKLRLVDDKAQSLFENCFEVLDGPDAPDLSIIEMNQELILTLSNCNTSNNADEDYEEVDPFIIGDSLDNKYRFQGYQIFQVKSAAVSVSEIHNPDLARLVAQTDVKDGVGRLINYYYDDDLLGSIPVEEVDGTDEGIRHSFNIKQDAFAVGDKRLINHKTYYFIAIAYAYNNYETYIQDVQPGGQKRPYLAGRKNCRGGAISVVSAIPHIVSPEQGGTIINAEYGDGPQLLRIEGTGNGGVALDITEESEKKILSSSDNRVEQVLYKSGAGPVQVKVFNPLNVPNAQFTLKILDSLNNGNLDNVHWSLHNETTGEVVYADKPISVYNEQLIEKWGLSVTAVQQSEPNGQQAGGGVIEATMSFSDSSHLWLGAIRDQDGGTAYNWIRSGISGNDPLDYSQGGDFVDPEQNYERVLGGTWAPYKMASRDPNMAAPSMGNSLQVKLEDLASVDVVITPDKSKWTRCAVVEMAEDPGISFGGAKKFNLRNSPSVGKDGKADNSGTNGMGWFPGYAINLETGERLNMMFGEDSWLVGENGRDMLWNPTANEVDDLFKPLFGGKHYIYVLGHTGNGPADCPAYDEGKYVFEKLSSDNYNPTLGQQRAVYNNVMWVNIPMLIEGEQLLSSDVRVRLRVTKPYKPELAPDWTVGNAQNDNRPMYSFNTADLQTIRLDLEAAKDALDLINVVPNPYYAYSEYEVNQFDNRVKITNLPDDCVVSVYSINGYLVKRFNKSDPKISLDWDMKNQAGIPISGGVYLIHVDAGEAGEKVVKLYAAMRPIDLNVY